MEKMKHHKHMPEAAEETEVPGAAAEEARQSVEQGPGEEDSLTLALKAIDALRAENAELKDRNLRALADMENLRKRTEREKAEATLYAATSFASDLLSVADNFSRALSAVSDEQRRNVDGLTRSLLAGVEVTERELHNIFERHGIRKMDPVGKKFDPTMHQAMVEVATSAQEPGTVVEVLQAGYAIGERCLRPALVAIAKAPDPGATGAPE
jgi:molecular chaperone GrpE